MKKLLALASLALAATISVPAQAEWLRAQSRHFVIYSDTNEGELHELATRLERFDGSVRLLYNMPDHDEVAANPLTIFVASDTSAIERLAGQANVAGFYQPRVTGAVAFTPRRGRDTGPGALNAQTVLFHEYAHHLLLANSAAAMPAWYSEGMAELVATARVKPEGVEFGYAANHRAQGLFHYQELPLTTLFAPAKPLEGQQLDQLYGRGWLLTHYISFNKERGEQMKRYLRAFASGTPPLDAARQSFGDLRQLDRELDKYMRGRLTGFMIHASKLPAVRVDIRPLSAGQAELIDERMVSVRGVNGKTAGPLYARAKREAVAADDAVAQGWLAEMAYDARQDADAEAAADRALAADPKSIQALLYKARIRLRRAAEARSTDPKVWAEARSWIVRANRLENNHAGALALFHQSFEMARAKPSPGAVAGVHHALALVPQDPSLRFQVARQDLRDGKTAEAREVLAPLAYAPHARPNNPAALLIKLIDSGQAGEAALAAVADAEKPE